MDLFEEDEIINHITYIMSIDFQIADTQKTKKAIEDVSSKFETEKLHDRKSEILKKLASSNLSSEESSELMNELNSINMRLKKWEEGKNNE